VELALRMIQMPGASVLLASSVKQSFVDSRRHRSSRRLSTAAAAVGARQILSTLLTPS
jgi:uncharacterized membrane protein